MVVVSEITLATYKLPPIHKSLAILMPPATCNAPDPITYGIALVISPMYTLPVVLLPAL